jgi:hypothetical protein
LACKFFDHTSYIDQELLLIHTSYKCLCNNWNLHLSQHQ